MLALKHFPGWAKTWSRAVNQNSATPVGHIRALRLLTGDVHGTCNLSVTSRLTHSINNTASCVLLGSREPF